MYIISIHIYNKLWIHGPFLPTGSSYTFSKVEPHNVFICFGNYNLFATLSLKMMPFGAGKGVEYVNFDRTNLYHRMYLNADTDNLAWFDTMLRTFFLSCKIHLNFILAIYWEPVFLIGLSNIQHKDLILYTFWCGVL